MNSIVKLSPLTPEEQAFAEENHSILIWYLNINRLDKSEYYDVAAMGYLQAVKKWFARPELRQWSFRTIAMKTMWAYVGNENRIQSRRIQTISLDEVIPGTDGLTYADTVTYENLNYFYIGGNEMNISYNVKVPERRVYSAKSDETKAFDAFRETQMKNMCIEYDLEEEAKKKCISLQTYKRSLPDKDNYDVFRVEKNIYIVRKLAGRKQK